METRPDLDSLSCVNPECKKFGHNLEKATPANVREFLDRHQDQLFDGGSNDRFVLNEQTRCVRPFDNIGAGIARASEQTLVHLSTA